MSINRYIMIMMTFSIPVMMTGYFVVKEEKTMLMPLMFILAFGMKTIYDNVKIDH